MKTKYTTQTKSPAMLDTVMLKSRRGLKLQLGAPYLETSRSHGAGPATLSEGVWTWQASAESIDLTLRLVAGEAGRWKLEGSLRNRGTADREARVSWPYLHYRFLDGQPARMFNPMFGGLLEATTMPLHITYPGQGSFCLTAAAGRTATVAYGLLNPEQRCVTIRHFPAGAVGHMRHLLDRVLVRAGETVVLPEGFIALGDDWGEAFVPYREWFASTFQRPRARPSWYLDEPYTETRKAHALTPMEPEKTVAGIWVFDDKGTPRTLRTLRREIDEAVADGEAKGYKPLFYQFGWWHTMATLKGLWPFDSMCGDYDRAHDLTQETIEYIHRRGCRTYLYTNVLAAGDESSVYHKHPEFFVRDASGNPVWNAGYPMLTFCPGAPGLLAWWKEVLKVILIDLDADGVFLDQACGGFPPQYCYDPSHRHAHPDTSGVDWIALIDDICTEARRLKSDALLVGELLLDSRSMLLDESHGYGYVTSTWKPPATRGEKLATPPSEYFAFTKYLTPGIFTHFWAGPRLSLMNGSAGTQSDPLWKRHRAVFEAGLRPCVVAPAGCVAYFYGPVEGVGLLAVRAPLPRTKVTVQLPRGLRIAEPLPKGVTRRGTKLTLTAKEQPTFFPLSFQPAPTDRLGNGDL